MPAIQNLVVTDRQTTPVNHTLTPEDVATGGIGIVSVADATGAAISKKSLSFSRRKTATRIRFTEKWKFPVMVTEIINGVSIPRVARVAYVDIVFNFDENHTEQDRKDVLGMIHSAHAVGKVLIEDAIVKDQAIY